MRPEITDSLITIKADKVHGANWLSEQAVQILMLTAEQSQAATIDQLISEIKEVVQALLKARPSMAAIANYSCRFLYNVVANFQLESTLSSLKTIARVKGEEIIKSQRQVIAMVAKNGADFIKPSDIIMTCSYSDTVCQCLEIAWKQEKDFQTIVADSMSLEGTAYGKVTAQRLKPLGISVKVIPDAEIAEHVLKATKILIGADSIFRDGTLVNGTPTLILSSAATSANVPLYTLCPTAKFDPGSSENLSLETGFDSISPHLITGIITELGTIKSSKVSTYIQDIEKYWQVMQH